MRPVPTAKLLFVRIIIINPEILVWRSVRTSAASRGIKLSARLTAAAVKKKRRHVKRDIIRRKAAPVVKNVRRVVPCVRILPWAFIAPLVLRGIRWVPILTVWEHVIRPLALRDNISTAVQTLALTVLREHTLRVERPHLVPAVVICSSAAMAA